jgi:hypothetical protein
MIDKIICRNLKIEKYETLYKKCGEFRCSRRVNSSCSTIDTRRVHPEVLCDWPWLFLLLQGPYTSAFNKTTQKNERGDFVVEIVW